MASLKDDVGKCRKENELQVYSIATSSSLSYDGLFKEENVVDFTYIIKDLSSSPFEFCREKDPINKLK